MKKTVLLLIALLFAVCGCSAGNKESNEELLANVKKACNTTVIEQSHKYVGIDVYRYDGQHYSIYNDSKTSQKNYYNGSGEVAYALVDQKDQTYGYDENGVFYTDINLTGEYERYNDLYAIDWDKFDLKKVERTKSETAVNLSVKEEFRDEYLKTYGLKGTDYDDVAVMLLVNNEDYSLMYRSETAKKKDSDVKLLECEYRYDEANPEADTRALLDDHVANAQEHDVVKIVIDPGTTIEQTVTVSVPAGDKGDIIMPEGYYMDRTRTAYGENERTYYLVNDEHSDLIIVEEPEEEEVPEDAGDVILEPEQEEEIVSNVDPMDASDFVILTEKVPDVILELRYYSTYNFVGKRIMGYDESVALITREAALALKKVSDELMSKGYMLKVYDAYRPTVAVEHFVEWAEDKKDTKMKDYFYPEVDKSKLFELGYIAEKSSHSRGSTVDVTLFDMKTNSDVDMGSPFDYFGEISHSDYTGISTEQYANRMLLRETMVKYGFKPLEEEWWHFTLEDEPFPYTYFSFPVAISSLSE